MSWHGSNSLRAFNPATVPTLQALRTQGHTYHAIARALGVSYATVYRAVNCIGPYAKARP